MRITGYGDGREYLSFTLSIITRRCGHGRTLLPISHICVSGGVDSSTIFSFEEETAKENQHMIFFLNYEKKLEAIFFITGWRCKNPKNMPRRERREKKRLIIWLNSAFRGMLCIVKRIFLWGLPWKHRKTFSILTSAWIVLFWLFLSFMP